MTGRLARTACTRIVVVCSSAVARAANDVVVTTSGVRLVGEIKSMTKDVLVLETDYSDVDFKIEWDKVASIESDRQFLVETFAGQRLSGSLKVDPARKGSVQVGDATIN